MDRSPSAAEDRAPVERVIEHIRAVYGGWGKGTSTEAMRRDWEALFSTERFEAASERVSADGVDAEWIAAPGARDDRTLVYFHGGGYRLGSVDTHRALIGRLSAAGNCRVLGVNYRLAPEHRFPAPIQDAAATYRWLLAQGVSPDAIAFGGDSAGGNLALAAILSLRDQCLPLPAAVVLLSPWTDLDATGESYATRANSDPIHQRAMILAVAGLYLGGADAADPLASPLRADLSGLPPMLIQVGDRETVLDDSRMLADRARAAGVGVELEVWDGMIHVFQLFASDLPEARRAIEAIGGFLRRHLG